MGIDSQSEICGGRDRKNPSLKPERFFGAVGQNDDQSAIDRLVPLSATIDTISMNFRTIKTSHAFDKGLFNI